MNLLPRSHKDFSSSDYWEKFFKRRGQKSFEWYGQYAELCGILHKYVKLSEKVLNIGCGNSTLSADMYDVGYKDILNIDISTTVIRQMCDKYSGSRPGLKYQQMNVLQMELQDGEFNVVLDKGTLDALMTDSTEETVQRVDKMFSEISRVLRVGGRYLCVSLAQEHVLNKALEYFTKEGWMTRICHVVQTDSDEDKDFHLPVFVYVFTKFKKLPNMKPVLEVAAFDDKVERLDSLEKLVDAVKQIQNYGIMRDQLSKGAVDQEDHVSLDLYSSEGSGARYTIKVVDTPALSSKFAAFIVPQGRENEWMFSSKEGRTELAKKAGFKRLLVVTLHRGHTYKSLDDVKAELSTKVMELAPPGLGKVQVPYLSLGDEISVRSVVHTGESAYSGKFVVEDVDISGEISRRLVFLDNQHLVQSETRLVRDSKKKKSGKRSTKLVPDPDFLNFSYYPVMVAGLALLLDTKIVTDSEFDAVLVGLGGGGLPTFIHRHFEKIHLDVVELDPQIVDVACQWFGLQQDNRLKVHVADGLQYIRHMHKQGMKKRVVIIDVDNKDTSVGMTCPPEPFLDADFLNCIDQVLEPSGVLMVNLSCRSQFLRVDVIEKLQSVFSVIFTKKIADDINEVIFAFPTSTSFTYSDALTESGELTPQVGRNLQSLQQLVSAKTKVKTEVTLIESLQGLQVLR